MWRAAHVVCAALALLFLECSSSRPESRAPDWLVRLPSAKGALYAVGISGPTYFQTDAVKWAADHAREELAKSLAGRVQSVVTVEQTQKGTGVQTVSATEATAWATDIVVSSSQVVATWVDVNGKYQNGKPGTTYALGLLDLGNVTPEVKSKAGQGIDPSRVEDVRKRAEKAFEELDGKK